MSVLIKGMEMPESCVKCRFRSGSCGTFCKVLNTWIDDTRGVPKDKRMDNCPLVELPSKHGRLIDADALSRKLKNENEEDLNQLTHGSIERLVAGMLQAVLIDALSEENAPTVLEAEVEEYDA